MKSFKIQLLIVILLSCFSVFPVYSALEIFEDEDVYFRASRNVYFKYEKQDDSKAGKNDHPVKLKEKEVALALESLNIWEKATFTSDEELKPVFTLRQTKQLGKYLARGLRGANSEQDILFALDKKSDRLLGLKTDTFFVAGRAFYKDGKLNIIIGDYNLPRHEGYESVADPTHMGHTRYFFNHGVRSSASGGFKEPTIKVPGVDNRKFNKKTRRDWFIIDVPLASEAYLAQLKERQNPTKKVDKQMEIEAAKLAKERREMRLEMARLRKEMKESGGNAAALTVEERLENLDKLKNKGLVSEDEYSKKREEILNDL